MTLKKSIIGTAVGLALIIPVGGSGLAFTSSGSESAAPTQESMIANDEAVALGNIILAECEVRLGVVGADGVRADDSRDVRANHYECLHEGFPQWYPLPATPVFAPPEDWQPSEDQLEEQNWYTDTLSDRLAAEGIIHSIMINSAGVPYVDYDQFDPVTADAVSEVIAKRDFVPDLPDWPEDLRN